jgi:DNA-directed RNA polymerase subunit RPC12/RpoP
MPIAPKPYKLVCPNCGFSKIVKIKSDVLSPKDIMSMSKKCPKCSSEMEKRELDIFDKIKTFGF